jgi:hypothetical protein
MLNRPSLTYLTDRQLGDLTEKMRAITVNWMIEAAEHFKLLPETLFLAVNLFDRCARPPDAPMKDSSCSNSVPDANSPDQRTDSSPSRRCPTVAYS